MRYMTSAGHSADHRTRIESDFGGSQRNNLQMRRFDTGEYSCEFCPLRKFVDLQECFTHAYNVHFPINFCMYCRAFIPFEWSISANEALKEHYDSPSSVHDRGVNSQWNCLYCFYRSNRKSDVDRHLHEYHTKEFRDRHCRTCGATFPTKDCYSLHLHFSCLKRRKPLLGLYPAPFYADAGVSGFESQNYDAVDNRKHSLNNDNETLESSAKRPRTNSLSNCLNATETDANNSKSSAKADLVEISTPINGNNRPTRIRFPDSPSPPTPSGTVETAESSSAKWSNGSIAATEMNPLRADGAATEIPSGNNAVQEDANAEAAQCTNAAGGTAIQIKVEPQEMLLQALLDSESSSDDESDTEILKNRKSQPNSSRKTAPNAKSSASIVCGRQTVFHPVSQPKRNQNEAKSSEKQKHPAKAKPIIETSVSESETQPKKARKDSNESSNKTKSKAIGKIAQPQLKRWSCTLCPMTSDYLESMKRHLETLHRIGKTNVSQYVSERKLEEIAQADGEEETANEEEAGTSAGTSAPSVATSSISSSTAVAPNFPKQKRKSRGIQVNFDEDFGENPAEEIEKLRAERDRYKRERDRLKRTVEGFKSFHMDMWERANKELSRLS